MAGAFITAALFTIGKSLIAWYLERWSQTKDMAWPELSYLFCCGHIIRRRFFSLELRSPAAQMADPQPTTVSENF